MQYGEAVEKLRKLRAVIDKNKNWSDMTVSMRPSDRTRKMNAFVKAFGEAVEVANAMRSLFPGFASSFTTQELKNQRAKVKAFRENQNNA